MAKGKRKVKVDMTGVESFVRCEEGEHIAVLKSIEEKPASSGNDMLTAAFEVIKGTSTGARVYDNFVLTEKALWKLKGFLEVLGMKADGRIVLDLDKLVGRTCIINVLHEEYNGSLKAKIDWYKKLEVDDEEDEDDDDEDDDIDDEDDEDDEEEEEEEEEEEKPQKGKKGAKKEDKKKEDKKKEDKKKPAAKSKGKKKQETEEDEDDEDDEDFDDDWDEE